MKKNSLIIISLLSAFLFFFLFKVSMAFDYLTMPPALSPENLYNALSNSNYRRGVAGILFAFLFAGGIIGIILGSIEILLSGGDAGKAANGKKIIIYSLIAVFIGSFTWTLINWVLGGLPSP